jgi:hypothetical protein
MSGPKTKEDFARQSLEAKRRAAERLAADIAKAEAALTDQAQPVNPPPPDPAEQAEQAARQGRRVEKARMQAENEKAKLAAVQQQLAELQAKAATPPDPPDPQVPKLQAAIEAARRGKELFFRSDRRSSAWSSADQERLARAERLGSVEWAD